jgi:hypothetical protein
MIYTGKQLIDGNDAYFIRLKNSPQNFIHFVGDNPDEQESTYQVKEGLFGACLYTKNKGEAFIKFTESLDLELVPVSELVRGSF